MTFAFLSCPPLPSNLFDLALRAISKRFGSNCHTKGDVRRAGRQSVELRTQAQEALHPAETKTVKCSARQLISSSPDDVGRGGGGPT